MHSNGISTFLLEERSERLPKRARCRFEGQLQHSARAETSQWGVKGKHHDLLISFGRFLHVSRPGSDVELLVYTEANANELKQSDV
jgi:hypothetical protein